MIKISVIIPIYNGEEYLEQCIQSVLNQTLKEIELVCVDDGSVDNSAQIIQKYAEKDKRISLFRQKNQGPGPARNFALKQSRGKFVTFLDADDYYLDNDALEKMVKACEERKVFICASLRKILIKGIEVEEKLFQETDKDKVIEYHNYQVDYDYQSYLFHREFLLKNECFFPDYRRYEDPVFLVNALFKAQKFTVANTFLYVYRLADRCEQFNLKNTYDLLCGLIDNLTYAQKYQLDILFKKTMLRLEQEYMWFIFKNFTPDDLRIPIKLLEANTIISEYTGKINYVNKPLRTMLLYASQYEKKILLRIKNQGSVLIYGAGRYGKVFLKFLKKHNLSENVDCFIVTRKKNNPEEIENIPVIGIQDLPIKKKSMIYVTVGANLQEEIENILKEKNCKNYEIVRDEFLHIISNEI